MATNYISQLQMLNTLKTNMLPVDLKAFYRILESLEIGSAQVEQLARPVREAIRLEKRRAYGRIAQNVLIAMVIIAVWTMYSWDNVRPYDSDGYVTVWVWLALAGGVALGILWGKRVSIGDKGQFSDPRDMVFLRMCEEGSMEKMLEELTADNSVQTKDPEQDPLCLLGPWTAKAALAVYVVMLVLFGIAAFA